MRRVYGETQAATRDFLCRLEKVRNIARPVKNNTRSDGIAAIEGNIEPLHSLPGIARGMSIGGIKNDERLARAAGGTQHAGRHLRRGQVRRRNCPCPLCENQPFLRASDIRQQLGHEVIEHDIVGFDREAMSQQRFL